MDYIICSVCECLYGGKDSLSALKDNWVWVSHKWFCPKHKENQGA